MKKNLLIILIFVSLSFVSKAQSVLYSEPFTSALNTCSAINSSSGAWIWSNSCTQSSAGGHTAPGHAIFSGSGCQYGNGSNTVSGDLVTPTIAIPALGGTLSFKYFILNECGSGTCFYDVLGLGISTNNGTSYTTITDSYTGILSNTSAWTTVTLSLNSYSNTTVKLKFNFNSIDGALNNYDGIYVDDINITSPCNMTLVATSGGNTVSPSLCSGNSLTLTAFAVSNYSWSTGASTSSIVVSPTATTLYSVSVIGSPSNCPTSSAVTVSVNPGVPVLSINSSTNSACVGKTVTLTATGATSYTWTGGVTNGVSFSPAVTTTYTVTGGNACGTSTAQTSITVAPLPVSIIATPPVVCAGKPALVTVTAAANSYSWQPNNATTPNSSISIAPTVNTIYTVAVSDGTCFGTGTVAIGTKPNPTVNVSSTATNICVGDLVTLTATGGSSYTWSPASVGSTSSVVSVNPMSSGVYSASTTGTNGCSSGSFVTVVTNANPTLNVSSNTNFICKKDTVGIIVSGASTYTWSNGSNSYSINVHPTSSTIYTVQGTSNICVGIQTVQINVFTPTISVSGVTTVCLGNSTTLTASGASSYMWSNNISNNVNIISPTSNTSYSLVTLTNSGGLSCGDTTFVQVTVLPNPTVTASAQRLNMCTNESNTISATGAISYTWNTSATGSSFTIAPTLVSSITYSVSGAGSNGCAGVANVVVKVNSCNGINEFTGGIKSLIIYPNPNNGEFTIESEVNLKLAVINQLGQNVKLIDLNTANNHQIKLSGLSSGIYFIKDLGANQISGLKIIVE